MLFSYPIPRDVGSEETCHAVGGENQSEGWHGRTQHGSWDTLQLWPILLPAKLSKRCTPGLV